MKKLLPTLATLTVLLLLLLLVFKVRAQPYYFSHSTAPYTNLTGATSLNNGQPWNPSTTFTVPIGFEFSYNGETFTNLLLSAEGEVEFPGANEPGIIVFEAEMIDQGTTTSASPISAFLYGTPGNQIRMIEWRNAGLLNGDPFDSVNFQLWLYESNGRIDIRFGPSAIDDIQDAFDGETGPAIGLVYNGNFSQGAFTGLVLTGPVANPQAVSLATPSSTDYFLTGMPAANQVYTFTTSPVLATADELKNNLHFYPNPATDKLHFTTEAPVQVSLFNSIGKRVLQQTVSHQLSIAHLPAGVYYLQTEQHGKRQTQRLIKQ